MLKEDVPPPYMAARQHVITKRETRTTRPLGAPREIQGPVETNAEPR